MHESATRALCKITYVTYTKLILTSVTRNTHVSHNTNHCYLVTQYKIILTQM